MIAAERSSQAGFTLLELLAAVALLSIGFTVFLNAMSDATQALTQEKQTTQLALLARSVFDDQTTGLIQPGQREGKIGDVTWHLNVTLPEKSPPVDIYQLELILETRTREERFITLRAQNRDSVHRR